MAEERRPDSSAAALLLADYAALERARVRGELSVSEQERHTELRSQLNRVFNPGLDPARADQRRSVRMPTRLACRFATMESFEEARITNLSSHGVFVATDDPLPVGTRLQLHIEIERSGADLEVPAVVVSSGVSTGGQSGMGMRFSDVVPEMLRQIDDLYQLTLEQRALELEDQAISSWEDGEAGGSGI